MATVYVSSVDGSDGDSGADWTNAKATVTGALAIATDPTNIIYVDSAHNHNAGTTITWLLSANTHSSIISVNRGTGAHEAGAIETVGASANIVLMGGSNAQSIYLEGVTLVTGTGANTINFQNNQLCLFVGVNCTFSLAASTSNTARFTCNTTGRRIFRSCTFALNNSTTGHPFQFLGGTETFLYGCSLTVSANVPATLIDGAADTTKFIDCDLSAWTGANVVNVATTGLFGSIELVNCKMHANATTWVTGTWPLYSEGSVSVINSDSGDTHDVFRHYTARAALIRNTSIYADGGAEYDAVPLSWGIVTTAVCVETTPYRAPWIALWQDSTGSLTFTLETIYDAAADLTDREMWMELEYLGNASFPLGSFATTRNAKPFDGTGVDGTDSAQSWTGTGGFSNANPTSISKTVTIAEKGLVRARLVVAKASQTLYLDPQLRVA